MPLGLLLLVVAYPLLELALLIKLGRMWGVGPTLALVIATGIAGALVLRTQGLAALGRMREAATSGWSAADPLVDGMLRAIAGLLLVAPGVLTDIAGALLLVPPVRRWVAGRMLAGMHTTGDVTIEVSEGEVREGEARASRFDPRGRHRTRQGAAPVIEGEFERLEERTADPRRPPPRER